MIRSSLLAVIALAAHLTCANTLGQEAKERADKTRQVEGAEDYFRNWLERDVVHIISQSEQDVFRRLQTPQEKEQFIEQFWFRRDPDPRTAANEFKEEHYRRLAYANERFQSGVPGLENRSWKDLHHPWRTGRDRKTPPG